MPSAPRDDEKPEQEPSLELEEEAPERPTRKPDFDLAHYAEKLDMPPMRERATTIPDEVATEEARLASLLIDSTLPNPVVVTRPPAQASLEPLSRVPVLAKTVAELGPGGCDPKSAYVLGFVDGVLPLETILEVTGLPPDETRAVLERFVALGVIVFPER